jgi:membrane fusion protein (multidrug efflux system)
MIIMLIVVGLVFGGVFGFIAFGHYMRDKFMHSMGQPPQSVATMVAGSQDWQPRLSGVGSLRAVNGADLSTQVAGTVSALHFDSGADVKAGTLLVELTSADDVAKLQSLKAAAALAQITLDRDQRQLKVQGVSQQTVDTDLQNLKSAQAQVAEQQANLGRSGPVRGGRDDDGHLAGARPDLRRLLSAATVAGAAEDRPEGEGRHRHLSGARLRGRNLGNQSQGR